MKKPVTEEHTFCDFCEKDEGAYEQCLVCGKDVCRVHNLTFSVSLDRRDHTFNASLCGQDAQVLKPLLMGLKAARGTWKTAGQNPEFNEAQLDKVLAWLDLPTTPIDRSQ